MTVLRGHVGQQTVQGPGGTRRGASEIGGCHVGHKLDTGTHRRRVELDHLRT